MDANKRELLLQKEVYAVVGCAIEVLNVRGHGLHEKIYENCLCVELRLRNISYTQQERHQVLYKGELVGEYIPDLVAQQKLIVDTRTHLINRKWVRYALAGGWQGATKEHSRSVL
jgi:GxxExxY protein